MFPSFRQLQLQKQLNKWILAPNILSTRYPVWKTTYTLTEAPSFPVHPGSSKDSKNLSHITLAWWASRPALFTTRSLEKQQSFFLFTTVQLLIPKRPQEPDLPRSWYEQPGQIRDQLRQQTSAFLEPGIDLWKTVFPWTRSRGEGLGMIQEHYIYCDFISNLMSLLI